MRNLTLSFSLVALIGAIASGVLFFVIGNTKQELHQQWQRAESQLDATRIKLTAAEARATELQDRSRVLDADLAAAKRDLTDTRLTLEQLQHAFDLAEESRIAAIAARESAIENLTSAHTELDALRAQLATSIGPADAQRYRQTIVDLESRIGELEQFITRKNADPTLVAGRAQYAQVVRVGPRNSFVVINFGAKHGARNNQRMVLSRGPETLASVEISKVAEHYSIAQVLPESLSGNLRQGDAAALTLKN
jgi:hypothetical protein